MKTKHFLFAAIAFAASLFFVGCGNNDDPKADPALTVDQNELSFTSAAGSKTIFVTSNVAWGVTVQNGSWVKVSPVSGENSQPFTVSVDENMSSTATRNATVTVAGGGITRVINVAQAGKNKPDETVLKAAPAQVEFAYTASTQTVAITANVAWTAAVSYASTATGWLTIDHNSGNGDAAMLLTATENGSQVAMRVATITLSGGGSTATIQVTQQKAPEDESSIKFDDTAFESYCVANFDSDKDGEISIAEAATVKRINVTGKSIKSLKGLEYFTALTYLNCSTNAIPSADFSKNTKLDSLLAQNNPWTTLDLSAQPDLLYLACHASSSSLTSLNVTKCTKLRYLNCGTGKLAALDLSKNTDLASISCASNQLAALDLSGLAKLTTLNCSMNKLTSLTLAGCTALKTINGYTNQIASLDLSTCTALTDIAVNDNSLTNLILPNTTTVKTLDCKKNLLTSLDLSKNTELTTLTCNNNKLQSLNLAANTKLAMLLNCNDNELQTLTLPANTGLSTLNCNNNKLTTLNLSPATGLTIVNCNNNQIQIVDLLANTNLTEAHCNSNKLTDLNVSANTKLRVLNCNTNNLASLDISKNTLLSTFDCITNTSLATICVWSTFNTASPPANFKKDAAASFKVCP